MSAPDPRPPLVGDGDSVRLLASRCGECGHVVAGESPACPVCGAAMAPTACGPRGAVWASTVVRIPVPGREPPYGLAYVDLEDGPRVLVHTPGERALPVGSTVELGPAGAGRRPHRGAGMRAAIHGVGTSPFAKQPQRGAGDLVREAVTEALADAATAVPAIDAAYVGTCFGEPGIAPRTLHRLGLAGIPIFTVEAACASGTTAFHLACEAVDAGRYERVLALGVETMTSHFAGAIVPEPTDAEGRQRHGPAEPLRDVGQPLPRQRLGDAGAAGGGLGQEPPPRARQSTRPVRRRADGRGGARLAADRRPADAAAVLPDLRRRRRGRARAAARRGARRPRALRAPPARAGSGTSAPTTSGATSWSGTVAAEAYAAAGIGPADADVFEVHDAFTIGEIVTTEALGLAAEGGGGELLAGGATAIGGAHPVNPSGGLLSRGHPLGATGTAQIAEVVWQLRGEAGGRQVEGARVGVVETMGGGASGIDGNARRRRGARRLSWPSSAICCGPRPSPTPSRPSPPCARPTRSTGASATAPGC